MLISFACISGCITSITSITVPTDIIVNEPFNITVSGSVYGEEAGIGGIVLQVPTSFRFEHAVCNSKYAFRKMKRSKIIEEEYDVESGYQVIALLDSSETNYEITGTVEVFVTMVAEQSGSWTVKAIAGGADRNSLENTWRSTDPKKNYSFEKVVDPKYVASCAVKEIMTNGTNAMQFDGVHSYVSIPLKENFSLHLDSSFTVETWFATTSGNAVLVSTRQDDFLTAFPFEISITESGALHLRHAESGVVTETTESPFVCDGQWHHTALVFDAESRTMFLGLDGKVIDSLSIYRIYSSPITSLFIASRKGRKLFFSGSMDEVRLWKKARSIREIENTKNRILSGAESFLYALYSFENTSGGYIMNSTPEIGIDAEAYNRPKLVFSKAPLEVEFKTFHAEVIADSVLLRWETFDEKNVERYIVEKRLETGSYFVISKQDALHLPTKQNNYAIVAPRNPEEVCYFRLKQVNSDGTIQLSEELPVGFEEKHNFVLDQNIPNPFYPKTLIAFTLKEATHVTLTVYDMLGRTVETIVDQKQPAGNYSKEFDGSDLPSGIYFYKLRTVSGSETKKMLLSQ